MTFHFPLQGGAHIRRSSAGTAITSSFPLRRLVASAVTASNQSNLATRAAYNTFVRILAAIGQWPGSKLSAILYGAFLFQDAFVKERRGNTSYRNDVPFSRVTTSFNTLAKEWLHVVCFLLDTLAINFSTANLRPQPRHFPTG